jgi:hypothetical protein
MTVEGLQIFEPKATADNSVPTVNMAFLTKGEAKTLTHAPACPIGNDFATDSMNMIDYILAGVGKKGDGLGECMQWLLV